MEEDDVDEKDLLCPICEKTIEDHAEDEASVCLEELNKKFDKEGSLFKNAEELR